MAANQYGIDLAGMYKDVEAIKGARNVNKLNALNLATADRLEQERPGKEAAALERKNILSDVRGKAAGGNVDAQQQLLTLDPEGAPSFIKAVGEMDATKREATKRTVDEIGRMSATVLQAAPERQAALYAQMRSMVGPDVAGKLPEEYSPQFMELSLSKAIAMDKILENPKAVQVGGEDVVYKQGREIDRAQRPVKEGAGGAGDGSGSGGIKSADENLMYKQAAELLGGIFDQQGNITNLDPQTRNKVQAIATEATKIYRTTKNITRTEAATMAAKKFGLNVSDAVSPDMKRNDGTEKGTGYFGVLKTPDGMDMTELSIGIEIDGKEVEIPSLVPGLTKAEIEHLKTTGEVTKAIADKAIRHARKRIGEGKSPFWQEGDPVQSVGSVDAKDPNSIRQYLLNQ